MCTSWDREAKSNYYIWIIQNLLAKPVANRAFMFHTWFVFDWIHAALSENTILISSVSACSITCISTSSTNSEVSPQTETLCYPSPTVKAADGPVYTALFCHALQSSSLSASFKLIWSYTLFQDCLCFPMPKSYLFISSGALQFMICNGEGITNTHNSRLEWEAANFFHVK